jgi:hypothetical protein
MKEQPIQERRAAIPVDDAKALTVRCTLCLRGPMRPCFPGEARQHIARWDYYQILKDKQAHADEYGI